MRIKRVLAEAMLKVGRMANRVGDVCCERGKTCWTCAHYGVGCSSKSDDDVCDGWMGMEGGKMESVAPGKSMWKTKDGTMIPVKEMTDGHLLNAMKMLKRVAKRRVARNVSFCLGCPPPTGDMAQMAFDQEFDYWTEASWEDAVPDIFNDMFDEALERGMDLSEINEDGVEAARVSLIDEMMRGT